MSWGSFINDITGASHSARQQYKYNLKLQQQNQAWQTEMANTAHQREVADLENAGLNPILSAGGGGADTGSPGGASVGGGVPQNPLEILGTAINAYAGIQQTKNNTAKTNADIINETEMTKANVAKALADAGYTEKQIEYYMNHGVFPGATITTSGNVSAGWGAYGQGRSTTIPVGLTQNGTNSGKAFKNMSKEKWKSLTKIQKMAFPKHLRELYNETYND